MEWDVSLATGNEAVDAQHRRLFGLLDELERSEHEGTTALRVLDELTEYVAVHFAMEEDLMRSLGYPDRALAEHVAHHRALTGRTREMVLAHRGGELASLSPLVDLLRAWLTDHIGRMDRAVADHAKASEAGS